MSRIDSLLKAYARRVSLPWQRGLSGGERVWFCRYDPPDERRLRARLIEFETATKAAGHTWGPLLDVTRCFEEWLTEQEYRDSYFEEPGLLAPALDDFRQQLADGLRARLSDTADDSVAAILGAGALFGIPGVSVSGLVEQITEAARGRLMVFFPGKHEQSNYRLLDARDGWNYRAILIEAEGS